MKLRRGKKTLAAIERERHRYPYGDYRDRQRSIQIPHGKVVRDIARFHNMDSREGEIGVEPWIALGHTDTRDDARRYCWLGM